VTAPNRASLYGHHGGWNDRDDRIDPYVGFLILVILGFRDKRTRLNWMRRQLPKYCSYVGI
jgi:hypothetical protein